MVKLSKKRKEQEKAFGGAPSLNSEAAIDLIKNSSSAKFDETLDIAVNLGVDPRHADQIVRGVCSLPHGTGRSIRVAVFAKGEKAEEAKKAGADLVGAEDLMEEIKGGKLDFDRCIATPDLMPLVGRLGKILGPRNLMPNPKVGTVTPDVTNAVSAAKSGEVQFKAEKSGVVHAGIGKMSFDKQKLLDNFTSFMEALKKAKPTGAKGVFIKKITISSTMGMSMVVDNEN